MHRHPPAPTPELIAAYRSARYRVSTPEGDVLLRVDAVNPCVAALLAQANAPWAVFVTAHQPFSHPVSADENAARQAELLAWAIARGMPATSRPRAAFSRTFSHGNSASPCGW